MSNRPNILILMVDQLAGTLFPDGPAEFLHAPHLRALSARSARFRNNYTASPLCSPARASFMSGQLPSRTGVYDNAAEFASSIPTFAHHLRAAGYHTCLSGKMHFVGPDQLHGFEERLTTDIYPADFGWTPDYRSRANASTGGITISVPSLGRASPRSPTRWSMTTRSPSSPARNSTTCRASPARKTAAPGA
jgi:choline-sulfatase